MNIKFGVDSIWLPPTVQNILEPVFLELGDLREYCELITISVKDAG